MWAVKQIYFDGGQVDISDPFETTHQDDVIIERETCDIYIDVFHTKEEAETFIRDESEE